MNDNIESEFGNARRGPGQQPQSMPEELIHAKLLAQHAQGILSDIIKGGALNKITINPEIGLVKMAFEIADNFDKTFQERMNAAVQSLPRIQKPPAGLTLK